MAIRNNSRDRKKAWIDPDTLFTRQEIAERSGISDEVLSFWIKRGLLISAEGGEGKGSHRRFRFSQINIAVILGVFRDHFGANVTVLSSLAAHLQEAVRLFEPVKSVKVLDWSTAASLGQNLADFRAGKPVEITVYPWEDPFQDEDAGNNARRLVDETRVLVATSEAQIIGSFGRLGDSWGPTILRLAESLGADRYEQARIAAVILGSVIEPGTHSDTSWLMRQTDEKWLILESSEGMNFETVNGETCDPAVFVPVGKLLRKTWGIPPFRELRNIEIADRVTDVLTQFRLQKDVTVTPSAEEGHYIDVIAPQSKWDALCPLLKEHGHYFRLIDPETPDEVDE